MTAPPRPVQLGDQIWFTRHLHRKVKHVPSPKGSYHPGKTMKVWEPEEYVGQPEPSPRSGVVIGTRTLANGERHYLGYEEGIAFIPEETFRAYLVAYDLHRNPVYVLEEHIVGWEVYDDEAQDEIRG